MDDNVSDAMKYLFPPHDLTRTMQAILGVTACAFCGRLLPRIAADDTDPVVKELGRLCTPCYERQEEAR